MANAEIFEFRKSIPVPLARTSPVPGEGARHPSKIVTQVIFLIFQTPRVITNPQNTTKMPSDKYKEEEKKILQALEILRKNPKQKIKPLARQFSVDYQRLRRRVLGSTSQLNQRPPNKRLSEDQERAIKLWIDDLDDRGLPPSIHMIKNYAERVHQNMYTNTDSAPPLRDH